MPVYEFFCEPCRKGFELIKHMSEHRNREPCPYCGDIAKQSPSRRTHFTGAKVEDAEWNPGLGMVTRNAKHRRDEAKARGMEEVGNESLETIHKHFDRFREDREKARWDDDRDKVYPD